MHSQIERDDAFHLRRIAGWIGAVFLAIGFPVAQAQTITAKNWGEVTAPVYGTAQTGIYAGAEYFAGPARFDGDYFHGVLPNGKIVRPCGTTIQVGEDPLGLVVTPDGRYVITSNDDERKGGVVSLREPRITGGYSLTVIDARTMTVVSHLSTGALYIGLQVVARDGAYLVYASGGADNDVKLFTVSSTGMVAQAQPTRIPIAPILPADAGYVSHYSLSPGYHPTTVPSPASATGISKFTRGAAITFPAGSALTAGGRYLYVACNGDNSLAVVDTSLNKVAARVPVGCFPYGVSISHDGTKVLVSNQGIQEYKFMGATYDDQMRLTGLASIKPGDDLDSLFYIPVTDTVGRAPKTSSITVIDIPGGDPTKAAVLGAIYQGHALDALNSVGDTHPTATAIVRRGSTEVEYVAKSNSDSLGLIQVGEGRKLPDFDLSFLKTIVEGHAVHGTYPNALAVSPDGARLYVAEAGLNSVAVVDVATPTAPRMLGRIPTGWYPSAVTVSPDGKSLFIANAKGVGADINPKTDRKSNPTATGLQSFAGPNLLFGTLQRVDTDTLTPAALVAGDRAVKGYNFAIHRRMETGVVPVGSAPSRRVKHVFFILHENKTFDSMLGNLGNTYTADGSLKSHGHFGQYASLVFNDREGSPLTAAQDPTLLPGTEYTQVSLNTQALALKFAVGVNYYSDSEESDAGHQFSASGTASDYTEKTLLVKEGRGLLVNKNFDPEDYPEGGYIFNNAARHGVSFKDYGALIRTTGIDTGTSSPASIDDPRSGKSGFPAAPETNPLTELPGGDADSPITGVGESYFVKSPILAILGRKNANGEPHLDRNYPSFNFNISDRRRAREFIADFDRMVKSGTLPTYLYIYQPNDHQGTGPSNITATNIPDATGPEEIADGDVALGMVVRHIMSSPVYYDQANGTGSAIFITYDDAQNGRDHIEPHRTPLIVVSPFAKPGYYSTRHYCTASIVKTEELLMGLPPNNYGDLFATDLRDLFQEKYNGVTPDGVAFNINVKYAATPAGRKIWTLAGKLDSTAPDRDSARLTQIGGLSMRADALYRTAARKHRLRSPEYLQSQSILYRLAQGVVNGPRVGDGDD